MSIETVNRVVVPDDTGIVLMILGAAGPLLMATTQRRTAVRPLFYNILCTKVLHSLALSCLGPAGSEGAPWTVHMVNYVSQHRIC